MNVSIVSFERACQDAESYSRQHPGKIYRFYRTPSRNHWVRQDDEVQYRRDGVEITPLEAYLGGTKLPL